MNAYRPRRARRSEVRGRAYDVLFGRAFGSGSGSPFGSGFDNGSGSAFGSGFGVFALGVLALGGVLAGCGSDEIDRAALTTTTEFASTHSEAIAAERERLGIPDDDGGALCRSMETWNEGFPSSVEATPAALAEVIGASSRRFLDVVVPAVPAELRDEADRLVATIDAAAASLDAVRNDQRPLDALIAAGALAGYVEYKALYDPAFTGDPSTPVRYRDALVAWIADPCGPKPLDSGLAPIGGAGQVER